MGNHAKPRTRVRSAALGALAVGSTLTGVGLTAAALDPAGVGLAEGTFTADPVNLAASGLGAPVPVASFSSLDGSTVAQGAAGNNTAGNNSAVNNPSGNDTATDGSAGSSNAGTSNAGASNTAGNYDVDRSSVGRSTANQGAANSAKHAGTASTATADSPGTPAAPTAASTIGTLERPMFAAAGAGRTTTAGGTAPSIGSPSSGPVALPNLSNVPLVGNLSTTADQSKSLLTELLQKVAGLV